jgi:hypothetical protein
MFLRHIVVTITTVMLAAAVMAFPPPFGTAAANADLSTISTVVGNNNALQALNGPVPKIVYRAGFNSRGDGGAAWYSWSSSNCSAPDNGAQVQPSAGTGCWIASFVVPPDVRVWGAKCDDSTLDNTALALALSAQVGQALHVPDGRICLTSAGLTVGRGTTLFSDASPLQNAPESGFGAGTIKCTSDVPACITVTSGASGSSGVGAIQLRNVAVLGEGGASDQIGVLIRDTYDVVLENVLVQRFGYTIYEMTDGIYGISSRFHNVETCQATIADLVVSGWPETRISQMRFGCNNDTIERSKAYIVLTGGATCPNTLSVDNSQFNAGNGGAACFIYFQNLGAGQGNIVSEYTFANNHFESGTSGEFGICSDGSVTGIFRLTITGNMFLDNAGTNQFWNLNQGTVPNDWVINNNQFLSWAGWKLAPSSQINKLIFDGNDFNGTFVALMGVGNSTVLGMNNFFSGISLSGSFYRSKISGINLGPYSNSASGITVTF